MISSDFSLRLVVISLWDWDWCFCLLDDLPFPLAMPLHPAVPTGAGRRSQCPVSIHRGRGLPLLWPLRPPTGHQLCGPGHKYHLPVSASGDRWVLFQWSCSLHPYSTATHQPQTAPPLCDVTTPPQLLDSTPSHQTCVEKPICFGFKWFATHYRACLAYGNLWNTRSASHVISCPPTSKCHLTYGV